MKIDKQLVAHVAGLANLELSADDVGYYETQLTKILDYIAQLQGMPDDLGSSWRSDTLGESTPERLDEVEPSLPVEVALANAPKRTVAAFQVPRIIE